MSTKLKEELDRLTEKYTMFTTFDNLLNAEGGYAPSLGTKGSSRREGERTVLANCYDIEQEKRGDKRRVYRW